MNDKYLRAKQVSFCLFRHAGAEGGLGVLKSTPTFLLAFHVKMESFDQNRNKIFVFREEIARTFKKYSKLFSNRDTVDSFKISKYDRAGAHRVLGNLT